MIERQPNPDYIPGNVSTGYQLQNENMYIIQTGLDTTEPFDNGSGLITIPAGGVVEANGVMFKITSNITLTKPNQNTVYWLAVNDNGNGTATIDLSLRAGIWDSVKHGFYNSQNRRILNWHSLGSLNESYIINNNLPLVFSRTVCGEQFVTLRSGWYIVDLRSGLGAGHGGNGAIGPGHGTAGTGGLGGGGGIPNQSNRFIYVIFHNIYESKNIGIFNKRFRVNVGGNGFVGADGVRGGWGTSGGGGGGGGGAGEESTFESILCLGINGGRGGNGGNNLNNAATGGAGGVNGGNGGNGGGATGGAGGTGRGTIAYFNPNAQREIVAIGSGGGGGGAGTAVGTITLAPGGGGGQFGRNRASGGAGGYCNIFEITG